jgi:hypothetical protein
VFDGKFSFGTGKSDETIQSTSSIDDGMWHHVVATREKSTGTIAVYVDGILEDSLSTENTQELSSPKNIILGANTIDSRYFKGNITQVAVWNITISSGGVKALYNSGIPLNVLTNSGDYTSASNLRGYWRFNEGTGLTTTDASGNNNNGTINGATWTTASPRRNTVITIDPANNFVSNQTVYAAIGATLEDFSDNVNTASSITFKTAFLNVAPLTFDLVYPYDDMIIGLTRDNFLDTLYFLSIRVNRLIPSKVKCIQKIVSGQTNDHIIIRIH